MLYLNPIPTQEDLVCLLLLLLSRLTSNLIPQEHFFHRLLLLQSLVRQEHPFHHLLVLVLQMRGAANNDGRNSVEGASVPQHSSSDSDDDWDGDPFLTDSQGNLTTWRLSDMEAAFEKHLEEEASKPKVVEKKYSKEEKLKRNADRKKQFMQYALQKYNNQEDLAGEMRFVFDEIKKEVYIVEEGLKLYEHFNFTAKQAGSTVLFFAEVVPHGKNCDVLCCKTLDCNDNGRCFGCKNQGSVNLRHPADEALYVGGHEDCQFPFMWDSTSEDDSD